jgi:hypothetical protein
MMMFDAALVKEEIQEAEEKKKIPHSGIAYCVAV